MPPFLLFPQADQNRRSCLDNETGLLVNHAYGLADMKARTHVPVLAEMLLGQEGPFKTPRDESTSGNVLPQKCMRLVRHGTS